MKVIINYINRQENLHVLSGLITLTVMALLYLMAQIFSFTMLPEKQKLNDVKLEMKELIKLTFTPPKILTTTRNEIRISKQAAGSTRVQSKHNAPSVQKSNSEISVASIVQGFDTKNFISREAKAGKRGGSGGSKTESSNISTNVSRSSRSYDDLNISSEITNRNSSMAPSRRSGGSGTSSGPKVTLGGGGSGTGYGAGSGAGAGSGQGSGFGAGIGSGAGGTGLSGAGGGRTTRGGGANSGAGISLPSGSGGGTATLDLHELIKWMKAHPGPIPKLIAYEMGHQSGDLSSAVPFTYSGRHYHFLLSCNEIEMLLRVCLVESDDYTMLKDNGIREESNYLTIGNVVREANEMKSLISSRSAPGDRAASFYQIFWSWWRTQSKK